MTVTTTGSYDGAIGIATFNSTGGVREVDALRGGSTGNAPPINPTIVTSGSIAATDTIACFTMVRGLAFLQPLSSPLSPVYGTSNKFTTDNGNATGLLFFATGAVGQQLMPLSTDYQVADSGYYISCVVLYQ